MNCTSMSFILYEINARYCFLTSHEFGGSRVSGNMQFQLHSPEAVLKLASVIKEEWEQK